MYAYVFLHENVQTSLRMVAMGHTGTVEGEEKREENSPK